MSILLDMRLMQLPVRRQSYSQRIEFQCVSNEAIMKTGMLT